MKKFAATAESIGRTASKLAKIAALAAYLRELEDPDLAAAARFFTGNPFPQRSDRRLAVGGRTIVAAAHAAWGVSDAQLRGGYRASGDLGTALAAHVRPPHDLGLFRTTLTPRGLMAILDQIASAAGKAATKRRQVLVERALGSCETELEAKYVIKILTGELRIGLREGLILEAIAEAFGESAGDVRRAAMAAGDAGALAIAAKHAALATVAIAYGAPIAFMLASPLRFGAEYKELAAESWLVEDKYDGVRIQVHKWGAEVRVFSRRLNETAAAWPEVTAALRGLDGDAILDGEIVAVRGGAVLPFRYLQPRLQRKDVTPALLAEIPVAYVVFDCLARGDRFLLDEPLEVRRAALADLAPGGPILRAAPWSTLEAGSTQEDVHDRFEAARERGNEGLLFKRGDSPYAPGKRGKWWLKLKRELDTIDAVVVAVEWGHGRRASVLSDYTFAIRGQAGEHLVIGKAYSGLTDGQIAELTRWFLDHRLGEPEASERYAELGLARGEIAVLPEVVVEIAFDIVQRSRLHKSGFALRFPRVVRLRADKSAAQIDTLESVRAIYRAMLERERLEEG